MHTPIWNTFVTPYLDRIYRISHSFDSKRSYKTSINNFIKFVKLHYEIDLDEILYKLKDKELDPVIVLDEYFTFMSKNGLKNRTIIGNISVIKDFLNYHGMHIYNEDIKQKFRLPKPEMFYEEGLTRDIIIRVLHNASPKLQVVILLACSSGARLGEITQLQLHDIDFSTNPTTIRLRRETTKTRETRFVHITTEATNALKDHLKKKFDWHEGQKDNFYLFLNNNANLSSITIYEKRVFSTKISLMTRLRKVVNSVPDLTIKNENGNLSIHFHAFRKWFKTQITNAQQSDFAEALMGHKSLKLVYYKQSHEERREMYKRVEPYLTMSDNSYSEQTIQETQSRLDIITAELEKVKQWKGLTTKYS